MRLSGVDAATHWLKHWLYDWNGANLDIFMVMHRSLADTWAWTAELMSTIGSYWGAPVVLIALLAWQRTQSHQPRLIGLALWRFMLGLPLAIATAALAKILFALPRPFVLLGDAIYRGALAPDSQYTMPSGHAVYVGVLTAALWPALNQSGKVAMLMFAAAVGWSRIVLGAHFPVDVLAGYALGVGCVSAMGFCIRRAVPPLPLARVSL